MHQVVRSIANVASAAGVPFVDAAPIPFKAGIPWVDPPALHLGNPGADGVPGDPVRLSRRLARSPVIFFC